MGLVFDPSQSKKLQTRHGIIVWLYKSRDQYKLRPYGDIVYFSKKNKFVIIYIDANESNNILEELREKSFVKKAELSKYDDLDFSDEHEEALMSKLKTEAEKLLQENEDLRL